MQTFLPYPDFKQSAKCLDRMRLGNQRNEAKILHMAVVGESQGWANHPAAKMWTGYHTVLANYGRVICLEWISRGYQDSIIEYFAWATASECDGEPFPPWIGDEHFHASHRSNLLRKNSGYYGQFGWTEPHDLPYYWPPQTDNDHESSVSYLR